MFKNQFPDNIVKEKEKKLEVNPMIAAMATVVAPPAEKKQRQSITTTSSKTVLEIPPKQLTKEAYAALTEEALNKSPIKSMEGELAGLEGLIKRRDEYQPDVLPNALLAGAQAFSDEAQLNPNVLKTVEGMINKKEKNDLQKLQDMIDARKEKANIAGAIGALMSKGVNDQIIEPKVVFTGESETKNGDIRSPGSGDDRYKQRRMSEYANKLQQAKIFDSMQAMNDAKKQAPDLFNPEKINDPVAGFDNTNLIGDSLKSKFGNIGLSDEDKQNRSAVLAAIANARVVLNGTQFTDGERTEWNKRIGDAVNSGNGSLVRKTVIGLDSALRAKRANLDQGYEDVAPEYYERYSAPKFSSSVEGTSLEAFSPKPMSEQKVKGYNAGSPVGTIINVRGTAFKKVKDGLDKDKSTWEQQ